MSETNGVETNPVARIVIRSSVLGGWKSTAVFAVIYLLFSVNELFNGNQETMLAFLCAGCGWGGWAIQEYQHLKGYVIKDV